MLLHSESEEKFNLQTAIILQKVMKMSALELSLCKLSWKNFREFQQFVNKILPLRKFNAKIMQFKLWKFELCKIMLMLAFM